MGLCGALALLGLVGAAFAKFGSMALLVVPVVAVALLLVIGAMPERRQQHAQAQERSSVAAPQRDVPRSTPPRRLVDDAPGDAEQGAPRRLLDDDPTQDAAQREDAERAVRAVIEQHAATLYARREQLVVRDPYGNVDILPWLNEVKYFLDHVVARDVPPDQLRFVSRADALFLVQDAVQEVAERRQGLGPSSADASSMTGSEFELACRDTLRAAGWEADVTRASGDQGVDVVARKAGRLVALQCKRYASPVGNKAVQEVVAAREFVGASHAAVVTTSAFTPAAIQLANACRVALLHFADLPRLEDLLVD